MIPELHFLDWIALLWFASCWIGYSYFSRYWSHRTRRLQDAVQDYIKDWIRVLQNRDLRIVDTAVVSNIEHSATFLGSSSLLIIAGLLTVTGSTDTAITFIGELPFVAEVTRQTWELKILLLVLIYAYAFFTFTWCMRQWGFASLMVGSAPLANDETVIDEQRAAHRDTLAEVVWLAIYSFNTGLRAYYFSLALLSWFLHPIAFMMVSTWVVVVLYRREFRSKTLRALISGRDRINASKKNRGQEK
jgi:uncharacterized membrane protein